MLGGKKSRSEWLAILSEMFHDLETIVVDLDPEGFSIFYFFGTSILHRMLTLVIDGLANSKRSSSTKESRRAGMNISRVRSAVQKTKDTEDEEAEGEENEELRSKF